MTIFLIFTMRPRDYLVVDVLTAFFSFPRRPRDFLVVDVHDNFLFFTTRPQDFLVVDVHDNFLFFARRPRDFLVVGVWINIFYFSPQDVLLVNGWDTMFIFHNKTTRSSRGGYVGKPILFLMKRPRYFLVVDMWVQPSLVLPGDHEIFSWWMCMTTFIFHHETTRFSRGGWV